MLIHLSIRTTTSPTASTPTPTQPPFDFADLVPDVAREILFKFSTPVEQAMVCLTSKAAYKTFGPEVFNEKVRSSSRKRGDWAEGGEEREGEGGRRERDRERDRDQGEREEQGHEAALLTVELAHLLS